jgi:dTDP-4-amino-4,6-dideoxygalactose transaminase
VSDGPIYVTRPHLPPLAEFLPMLEEMWESRVLTNNGPFHERLQEALRDYLEVANLSLTANGMIALETAIEAADLHGEVITTPFSFVATTHAIQRAGLTPVFVDIRADDLNIDPSRIEAAITDRTSAIVAVHCYGNACAVDALDEIAERRGLKLIYDAAHAFGVRLNGRSLLSFGDLSILSFHATKMFSTFEGGAVVTRSSDDKRQVDRLRNFGILDEVTVAIAGRNGKMSEFNAALGLLQLKYVEQVRSARAAVSQRYRQALADLAGVEPLPIPDGVEPNHSYFPVLVTEEFPKSRDELYESLKARGIYGRRYFYPLLASLPMYRDLPSADPQNLPIGVRAAEQILCLPIYPDLRQDEQDRVIAALFEEGDVGIS